MYILFRVFTARLDYFSWMKLGFSTRAEFSWPIEVQFPPEKSVGIDE